MHAPGFVPVDKNGKQLLERVPIWQDERSFEQGQRLLDEIGSDWVGLGMPFAAFGAKLRWFIETHPDLARSHDPHRSPLKRIPILPGIPSMQWVSRLTYPTG